MDWECRMPQESDKAFPGVLKGAIAVMVTQAFTSQPVAVLAGLAAVTGHIRPLYIGFKGGRGESTAIGVLFTLLPQAMLIL